METEKTNDESGIVYTNNENVELVSTVDEQSFLTQREQEYLKKVEEISLSRGCSPRKARRILDSRCRHVIKKHNKRLKKIKNSPQLNHSNGGQNI